MKTSVRRFLMALLLGYLGVGSDIAAQPTPEKLRLLYSALAW
jgi:hypothetical protein